MIENKYSAFSICKALNMIMIISIIQLHLPQNSEFNNEHTLIGLYEMQKNLFTQYDIIRIRVVKEDKISNYENVLYCSRKHLSGAPKIMHT